MLHCIVVLYQVCSNEAPGSKMVLHQGVLYSNYRNNKKNQTLLLQNHFAQILKFNMWHCLVVFYQMCSNGGVKMARPQRVLGLNHRNRWNILKNLLQNHLPQMFEIRFVALPGGLLPSLFKSRFEGRQWPYPRGSWV